MKYVKKIIFRNKETYNRLYQGSELLFEVQKEVDWKGLTFTALENSTIKYTPSNVTTAQYSYDAVNWNSADNITLNLNTGDKVYFKGNITDNQTDMHSAKFTMTGKVAASGSIMSLQAGDPTDNTLKYYYEFSDLFWDCTSLVTAPDLPATTLKDNCYEYMFNGCTSLKKAPELPATTLREYCYANMFCKCTSLTTAPELPATILALECYWYMFYECSSLTTAPSILPATTLKDYCYIGMFSNCTSLTKAPVLPATTLVNSCYEYMFKGCSKLNYIKALFNTKPELLFTQDWVNGVASTGTFVKNSEATWDVTGTEGIPEGWTIHIEEKPKVEYD